METKKLPNLEDLQLKYRSVDLNKTNNNISTRIVSNYREENQLISNVEVEIVLALIQILKYFTITFFFVYFFSSFFLIPQ
ncbi:hypothetical protein [Mastigocoleus testarum]|uniref:Uncharacterized protein n=1 Tax=Mastigocoleus testarum BC008 TaxID=371196 RepID=A0A0V7ZYL8_9CYAN|nr:hypothetical protein [Mastigocoleus testarum]KST69407.1 hypothetical protein BC008_35385 [Mastigocoleus testarum BC008]